MVLLSGEHGTGNSLLMRALEERIIGQPYLPQRHFCSPYHRNSTLYLTSFVFHLGSATCEGWASSLIHPSGARCVPASSKAMNPRASDWDSVRSGRSTATFRAHLGAFPSVP